MDWFTIREATTSAILGCFSKLKNLRSEGQIEPFPYSVRSTAFARYVQIRCLLPMTCEAEIDLPLGSDKRIFPKTFYVQRKALQAYDLYSHTFILHFGPEHRIMIEWKRYDSNGLREKTKKIRESMVSLLF